MDNRRLLVAFTLSLLVIVVWYWLFPPPKPEPPRPPAEQERVAPATPPAGPGGAAPSPAPGAAVTPAAPAQRIEAAAEERVTLTDGTHRAVLTNRGAQLLSMVVPERTTGGAGGELEMVRRRAAGPYPYALAVKGALSHPLNDALFRAEKGADGRAVLFRYSGPLGNAEKRFRLNDRGLLEVEVRVPGRTDWRVLVGPGIRNPTPEELKSRFELRRAVYLAGGDVERLDAAGEENACRLSVAPRGRGLCVRRLLG